MDNYYKMENFNSHNRFGRPLSSFMDKWYTLPNFYVFVNTDIMYLEVDIKSTHADAGIDRYIIFN